MTSQPENTSPEAPAKPARSRAWRYAVIGGVAIAAVVGVNVAMSSGMSSSMSGSSSPGWGGHSRMHAMMGGMGLDFVEWRVQRALTDVGAARETSEEVAAIVRAAADDILPIMLDMRNTREEAIRILTAPTIDREAAEALRRARIEGIDAASQRALAGLLDAAESLTVEERTALIDKLAEKRHRRRW